MITRVNGNRDPSALKYLNLRRFEGCCGQSSVACKSAIVARHCTCCTFFVLWTMALSNNKQSHPLTKSLKLTWLFGNFSNLVQSVVHLHDCSARQPFLENLVNTGVKILAEVWTLTVAVPPHFSTTEVRVSPTCPSSDCFHKLNSNNTDNDRVSVQRRTARLEERPIAFVLLSVQPMELANPCRGVAAY